MKHRYLVVAIAFLAVSVPGQEQRAQLEALTPKKEYFDWNDPEWWDYTTRTRQPGLQLGKSEFFVAGPLYETWYPGRRYSEDRSLGQKILDFPIINLFVPQPMTVPRQRARYFAWGQSDVPWSNIADGALPGESAPRSRLISIGW